MADPIIPNTINLGNFVIGCVGAIAPEALRIYNLRTQSSEFKWSWSYLIFSIPFILVGGFVAYLLEPTTKWAAFYSGLTTPVLLTTAIKDTAKAQKELNTVQLENQELERKYLEAAKKLSSQENKEEKIKNENELLKKEIEELRLAMNRVQEGDKDFQDKLAMKAVFKEIIQELIEEERQDGGREKAIEAIEAIEAVESVERIDYLTKYLETSMADESASLKSRVTFGIITVVSIVVMIFFFSISRSSVPVLLEITLGDLFKIILSLLFVGVSIALISRILRRNDLFQKFLRGL